MGLINCLFYTAKAKSLVRTISAVQGGIFTFACLLNAQICELVLE